MTTSAAAPGWYPDPWYPGGQRWFDGANWTEHASGAPGAYAVAGPDIPAEQNAAKWAGYAFLARGTIAMIQVVVVPIFMRRMIDWMVDLFDQSANSSAGTTTFQQPPGMGAFQLLQPLGMLAFVAAVFVAIWTHRATQNARLLGQTTSWSPAWAVAGWFVPIANLFIPYQVVRDLFPEGHPQRRQAGRWWACEIGAGIVGMLAMGATFAVGTGAGVAVGLLAAVGYFAAAYQGYRLTQRATALHAERAGAPV